MMKKFPLSALFLWIGVAASADYYFYGDLNLWSIKDVSDNCGCPVTALNLSNVDITNILWPDGEGRPSYYDADQLNADWRLKACDSEHPAPTVDGVKSPDNWYYIDFANLSDYQNQHTGRLCGQFKITCGAHDDDNWGLTRQDAVDYLKNKITVGEIFGEDTYREGKSGFTKGNGLQNFELDCSYVDNAVLYFNPTDMQILVTGTPQKIYVYYAQPGDVDFSAPKKWRISDKSQTNYWANSTGFNSGSAGASENNDYNPIIDGQRQYYWEEYDNDGQGVEHDGYTYKKTYRRLIPYGATHRFPVPFTVTVANSKGAYFQQQEVSCESIWFIESTVNLYFRDVNTPTFDWVGYNIFGEGYDDNGDPSGFNFAYGSSLGSSSDANNNGTWVKAEPVTLDDGYVWYKSQEPIPSTFIGKYALFTTSTGVSYPAGLVKATSTSLSKGTIHATQDLYYVVGETSDRVSLLYTHLSGSYKPQEQGDLQIEAEFFNEDGTLDNSLGKTKYRFEVYKGDEALTLDVTPDQIIDTDNGKDGYQYKPYCTVLDAASQLTESCYLHVVVKVKDAAGNRYVYQESYPVFI